MNLLLIFILIFHKTLKKPCLCDSDIYFLFGRFHFQTAIASKPFFPPTFLACTLFSFFFFFLKSFVQWAAFCRHKELWQVVRVLFFGQGAFLTRRRERNGLFCIMITADCIFPPFCYSSYVKKIRNFLTFDAVVSQRAMSLSSARIVARIPGGRSSRPPLRGSSDTRWHFSLRRTDGHVHAPLRILFLPLFLSSPPSRRWQGRRTFPKGDFFF